MAQLKVLKACGNCGAPARHRSNCDLEGRIRNNCEETSSGCWIWRRATLPDGRPVRGVQRIAYRVFLGVDPVGLAVRTVCGNPACCCPGHLEAVKPRLVGAAKANAERRECVKGHRLSRRGWRREGRRDCPVCTRAYNERRRRGHGS